MVDAETVAKQAREEHDKLNREIEILKLRLLPSAQRSIADWFEHCTEHFRHFHTQLRRHMEVEEYGGYMKPVRELRPTLTPRVESLKAQHREMLRRCAAIECRLEDCQTPGDADVVEVRQDIEGLLQRLEDHKTEENRLIQRAFLEDIGAGD